ncbi:MAG TPA: isoprenyl transferase [Bacillota bacterium]|nr:isoprenyl transferase [Bacillota bacterium]
MRIFDWLKNLHFFKNDSREPGPRVVPSHIAIIMDGNGRWAQKRGLPRFVGHRTGLERVRDAVEVCLKVGVKHLTLYAFSTENWNRPAEEVGFLMNLFEESLGKEVAELHQNGVKIRFIGLKQELNSSLIRLMEEAETLTSGNTSLTLNIAINYGGRAELTAAMKGIARAVARGELDPEQIGETDISNHLFTAGQPDPDLLIKPGREYRISNFLIWQMAYTEFYFSQLMWPEFGKEEILKAIDEYSKRERRFGTVKEGGATR